MKKKASEAHKEIVAREAAHLKPLKDAEIVLKQKIGTFQAEEKERLCLEQLEREKEAKKREEEQRLAEAEVLEQLGETEAAEKVLSVPISAPPPPSRQVAASRLKGVSTREKWGFEVVDEKQIPREYLAIDMKKIGAVVRAMKGNTNIAGITVYKEEIIAAKAS